jgi:1,4-alpha-glucan branching enzyme
VLNTDDEAFGGHSRVDNKGEYFTTDMEWNGRRNFLQVYIPSRTALVLGL